MLLANGQKETDLYAYGITMEQRDHALSTALKDGTVNLRRSHNTPTWRKISENDPAYQILQITTSVSLYLKVYFLQFLL
jgi:hypothetical protein